MALRRKALLRTASDHALWALLLKPYAHDFFGQVDQLGGQEVVRAYWEAHREDLLAEFADTHTHDAACGGRPREDGVCRPLGWHLFDRDTSEPEPWAS